MYYVCTILSLPKIRKCLTCPPTLKFVECHFYPHPRPYFLVLSWIISCPLLSSPLLSSLLQAWLLALLAAQQDWRLGLLRLGHLHHLGDENIPPDPDLAYAYYANIAKQTSADRQNLTTQQVALSN